MGLGILEPRQVTHIPVPGSVLLDTDIGTATAGPEAYLKRDPNRNDIILRPQPSDSPDDPLNWSRLKKELFFLSLSLSTAIVGVIGPVIVPSPPQIIATFPTTTVTDYTALVGYLVLTYGISSYFAVCLSECFGRRPASFISHLLLLWGIVWAASAQSYGQLLGARIVQGFGMGVVGCLGSSFITDVFFLHEQGLRLALWQISFNATICFTPIIAGVINGNLGWRYLFWLLLPFEVIAFVAFLFLQPESIHDRRSHVASVTPASAFGDENKSHNLADPGKDKVEPACESLPVVLQETGLNTPNGSRFSAYRLWGTTPVPNYRKILFLLFRPMLLLLSPCVVYATLLFTFTFSWFVLLACVYSGVYSASPFNLSSASVGYLCGGAPLIGVLSALISSGPILDRSAQFFSRRNGGLFEPEFRLILNIPMAVCFAIGAFGWGYSVQHGQNVIVTGVYLAILNAGAAFGTIGSISYAVSLYPARGGATFGIIMLVKAIYAWSATLYIAEWFASYGPFVWSCTVGTVTMALIILGIPFWIYGKRIRSWLSRNQALDWIFLEA